MLVKYYSCWIHDWIQLPCVVSYLTSNIKIKIPRIEMHVLCVKTGEWKHMNWPTHHSILFSIMKGWLYRGITMKEFPRGKGIERPLLTWTYPHGKRQIDRKGKTPPRQLTAHVIATSGWTGHSFRTSSLFTLVLMEIHVTFDSKLVVHCDHATWRNAGFLLWKTS